MSDTINQSVPEIVYESIDDSIKKSNKLNYKLIKELCAEAQAIRSPLHQTQSQDVLNRLEAFIDELNKLKKSSSKYLAIEEVMSDMEWIIEYKRNKKWLHVTRRLCNLEEEIREHHLWVFKEASRRSIPIMMCLGSGYRNDNYRYIVASLEAIVELMEE